VAVRLHGPTQGARRADHDADVRSTREASKTRKAEGPVDTFDANNRAVVADAAPESKGFFGKIFSAIGNFFSSLWSFLTGKGWQSSQPEVAPAKNTSATVGHVPGSTATTPTESLRPQDAASVSSRSGNRVASTAPVRTAATSDYPASIDQVAGFRSRASWGANSAPHSSRLGTPTSIVVHETQGGSGDSIKELEGEHSEYGDIGYQFAIMKDKNGEWALFEGRERVADGALALGRHAKGQNSGKIGIVIAGDYRRGGQVDPAAQRLMDQAVGALMNEHPSIRNLYTHKDLVVKKGSTLDADHTDCSAGPSTQRLADSLRSSFGLGVHRPSAGTPLAEIYAAQKNDTPPPSGNASIARLSGDPVASGATFGGVPIRAVDQWYESARGTVFGGGSDPEDNGIGAFGFRTGTGGREGVAIPQRVMAELTGTNDKSVHRQYKVEVLNRDTGERAVFEIVDRGPSERIWQRAGRAVVDLTEGAVAELGGRSHKNSRGQTIRTSGIDNLSFRIIRG